VELLEDDDLGFDVTDEFGYDPPGHLSQNKETLLNNFYLLPAADLNLFLDDYLFIASAIEIARAVEVVEAAEGRKPAVVVERNISVYDGCFTSQAQRR